MGKRDTIEIHSLITDALKYMPLLKDTDEETRFRLALLSSLKYLAAHEVLHASYDTCREVSYVVSGSLKIVRYTPNHRELVLRRVQAGETFGEVIALSRERYPGWLIALEPSQVLEIPIDEILSLCSDRIVREQLLFDISHKALALSRKIELLSAGSLRERLGLYLLDLCDNDNQTHLTLPMSVTELAGCLGCSREYLSRLFTILEDEGVLIQRGRKVNIRSMDLLIKE